MVDKSENILVEFDYNNITIVDPNKVIDSQGKVKDRNVKQEDLVMYANLECKVLPRTKLALGVASNDQIRTISVASINFLNPGNKGVLDNSYTDEITGRDSLAGNGVNQPKTEKISNPKKSDDYYLRQTILSNGKPGSTDNGLLGITNIQIRQGLDFLPTITMELEDIKGRAMFEAGNNSPYAAFFNLPYPLFYLTIKGYYGKAVKMALMLQNFTSRYDTSSGNFKISLTFYTYKYTVLNEVLMGYLQALPNMYTSRVKINPVKGGPSNFTLQENQKVELGYQKIKELYSEYKSKGLIPDDFPEITILQLKQKLEKFVKEILDKFTKQNMDPLTDLDSYTKSLEEYTKKVYYTQDSSDPSWFYKYMDTENFFVLNDGTKVYTYKKEFQNKADVRRNAPNELDGVIKKFNAELDSNKTIGTNGSYKIDNKVEKPSITSKITIDTFKYKLDQGNIDYKESYRQQKKLSNPSDQDIEKFRSELIAQGIFNSSDIIQKNGNKEIIYNYFIFEGNPKTFIGLTNQMYKDLDSYRQKIQNDLTEALSKLLLDKGNNGIGFIPSIRNVLAVLFANAEAFLRLMDDIHNKAWNQRDNPIRKDAIFDKVVSNASQDNLTPGDTSTQPVYPWPQFIVATNGEDGHGKYEIKYPGEYSVLSKTKGYLYDVWPEIEFVEEFIKGFTTKVDENTNTTPTFNELTDIQRVSVNAIEYPVSNVVYNNKEEVKFFYEIFERLFLTSNYSRLFRSSTSSYGEGILTDVISETESLNIINSLSNQNPFIIQKLKQFGFNGQNFDIVLRHMSNDGTGESWQNFIRGIFNTTYIKNLVNNSSFQFINENVITSPAGSPISSLKNEDKLVEYVNNNDNTNDFDLLDTYPFTILSWDKTYLANGDSVSDTRTSFSTKNVITYNKNSKVISNFLGTTGVNSVKPFANFATKNVVAPLGYEFNLKTFYEDRLNKEQLPTEGNLRYSNYNGQVSSNQTVSMLNTPYFVNSIQEGVKKYRNYENYPYVSSAYLFINSLPLSTLREKYKTYTGNETTYSVKDLDYIFATLKKFGAIHKIPYAWLLKIGSVWHRYKTYVETGNDILNESWSGFSYAKNYDPVNNSPQRIYPLTIDGAQIDVVLEKNTSIGLETSTVINTGFYPKLINDFNVFYQGFEIYSGYTDNDIQLGFTSGVTLSYVPEAIINLGEGFDESNLKRDLRIIPWSVYVNTFDKQFSYLFPSQGSTINQTLNECFSGSGINTKMVFEVTGNTAMYDGSVRLFWTAPNYGYFDNSKVVKSSPSQYLKKVFSNSDDQENFSINGNSSEYTEISEMFSIFEKSVLDLFETEFLNFSKSAYDYNSEENNVNSLPSDKSFKNFQLLFRDLMKLPVIKGENYTKKIDDAQKKQLVNFTDKLDKFLNYNVVFKYGNPSNFDKRLFYSFSNLPIVDPYTWEYYSVLTPNALPPQTTLINSQTTRPNVWEALKLYVGYSEIPELVYKDSGSYITDFFIDLNVAFNVDNVIKFAPIIKIYATQKLKDNTLNLNKFYGLMNNYFASIDKFRSDVITNLMIVLRTQLPDVNNSPEAIINSRLSGDQTKVEQWETFKALNDKWIAGGDFKTKTLFEDVLLLDRASRNIGDKIYVDILSLKQRLTDINEKTSFYTFIATILTENNFQIMNLPSYVNFYNVQDVSKNPTPKAEGSLEFANTLFGNFMNVDYRESSPKLVCFYAGKTSEQLAIKNNVDYRFRDDAFELTRQGDNPLFENQVGKKDWDKSNKVVGFNVDIGPQNQSIFHSFQVAQNPGLATMESLAVETQMSNLYNGTGGATQNISLYNLYKNRSYSCTLFMMGNALIQPTMYFNLRHVPMFSGPYMIQKVNHTISPGHFETIIEGIRQPTAELPKIENYIQVLKQTLLTTIVQKIQQEKTTSPTSTDNVKGQTNQNYESQNDGSKMKDSPSNKCQPMNIDFYKSFTPIDATSKQSVNYDEVIKIIKSLTQNVSLQYTVFATLYIATSNKKDGLTAYDNNYSNITIDQNWGEPTITKWFREKKYFCGSVNQDKTVRPYVRFENIDECIGMLCERWKDRMGEIKSLETPDDIAKFWILNNNTSNVRELNVYTSYNQTELENLKSRIKESFQIFNPATGNVTNTQPSTQTTTPPPGVRIVNLGVFNTVQGNDNSYYNIQKSDGKYVVLKIENPISNKGNASLTQFLNANNVVIPNGCVAGSGAYTCTVNGQNPGLYTMSTEYYPKGVLESDKVILTSSPFEQ